ncbi:hypothetical protein HMPREF0972_01016 [Actinomyces sp. oral taxon 848 str. F0332]|nr:hypothetical protein HMPREF0972_01016 [Actinomyces sp. oral taxon 848 str. F0332]
MVQGYLRSGRLNRDAFEPTPATQRGPRGKPDAHARATRSK